MGVAQTPADSPPIAQSLWTRRMFLMKTIHLQTQTLKFRRKLRQSCPIPSQLTYLELVQIRSMMTFLSSYLYWRNVNTLISLRIKCPANVMSYSYLVFHLWWQAHVLSRTKPNLILRKIENPGLLLNGFSFQAFFHPMYYTRLECVCAWKQTNTKNTYFNMCFAVTAR